MDGFFIWTRDVARRRSHLKKPDLSRRIVEQGCASFGLPALKKGAGIALTRLATPSHNQIVREYVHGGKVLAQPMTSE
jgi:hypothetical protein